MVASDKEPSLLAAGFQGIENTQTNMSEEAFCTQDGNLRDGFRTAQADNLRNMGLNRPFSAQLRFNNTETSTRELLSSICCTGVEPCMKDIAPAIRSNPAIMTGLYCSEGLAKELNTFSSSNPSGISNMYASDLNFSGFNATTCHVQRPWVSQKAQNYQVKSSEKDQCSQSSIRLPRPPGEGRGKNQLLPRYWPRITKQELQLLNNTKDSNCIITPLFEKVLSASDAGKIGRLVLPKACAEAYFPPISQAEGLPITVQDISGKDWQFQFRFWPNNNSRMYVLEGITPCIQSMQLQAGDTVTFSRRDPEGKLVMGYRRASNSSNAEETRIVNGTSTMAPSSTQIHSRKLDKPSMFVGTLGVNSQAFKTSSKVQGQMQKGIGQIAQSQRLDPSFGFSKAGAAGSKGARESSLYSPHMSNEKRKGKDVSLKTKKPKCDAESLDFKMNWEQAQNLLRSPPNVTPSIVTIEGYDFEEYEDPPVFGNELISCDNLHWKFCNPLQDLPKLNREGDLQYVSGSASLTDSAGKKLAQAGPTQELETFSGLETLAYLATAEENVHLASSSSSSPATTNAAVSGSVAPIPTSEVVVASSAGTDVTPPNSSSVTTTKHPRHRPGCSCIVCIQPPSGKGPKHKPTCVCNVCVTVKRRFQTLMLRRKKLQSEKEGESSSQKNQHAVKEVEIVGRERKLNDLSSYKNGSWQGCMVPSFSKATAPRVADVQVNRISGAVNAVPTGLYAMEPVKMESDNQTASKGPEIDLNSQPEKEEEMSRSPSGPSMRSLLQNASYPLEKYLKQHGLQSLVCTEQLQQLLENSGASLDKKSGDTSMDRKDDDFEDRLH